MRIQLSNCMLFVSLLLRAAPAFAADRDFCSTVEAVAGEADDRFRKFRNGSDGTGDYATNLQLPGSSECYIAKSDPAFICFWNLGISKDADDEARKFSDALKSCFPGGSSSESLSVPQIGRYKYLVRGIRLAIGVDIKKNRVRFAIEKQ